MKKINYLYILTLGVFSILNTEMGMIGILSMISNQYEVSLSSAGLLVSLFALMIAISGPISPLLFSRFNKKKVMVLVLSIFFISNIISTFTDNFTVLLLMRIIPAIFHPVYVSLALSTASSSVDEKDIPKAVSKVMMGVSAGMVLGAPVVATIADIISLQAGMLFFAVLNGISLLTTILFVPNLPVKTRMTYGSQIRVLKQGKLWISIIGVIFLNGSIFGVYSYLSVYLERVTLLPIQIISILLFLYGLFNIVGNGIAGRELSKRANKFVMLFPLLLAILYALLFMFGGYTMTAVILIMIWGILAGAAANINQYWITSAAPEALEFANGLFLSATNLGTAIGTPICGAFISTLGTQYILLGGLLLIICCAVFITIRVKLTSKEISLIQSVE